MRGSEGISVAFRGTCKPEKPCVFAAGEPGYDNLEVMKSSSSVNTVLIVGVGLEQIEILR